MVATHIVGRRCQTKENTLECEANLGSSFIAIEMGNATDCSPDPGADGVLWNSRPTRTGAAALLVGHFVDFQDLAEPLFGRGHALLGLLDGGNCNRRKGNSVKLGNPFFGPSHRGTRGADLGGRFLPTAFAARTPTEVRWPAAAAARSPGRRNFWTPPPTQAASSRRRLC